MAKETATTEAPAASPTPQKGAVLAAPGSGSLRWICEDCIPSHLAAGWRRADAQTETAWLAKALEVGLAPEGAELIGR